MLLKLRQRIFNFLIMKVAPPKVIGQKFIKAHVRSEDKLSSIEIKKYNWGKSEYGTILTGVEIQCYYRDNGSNPIDNFQYKNDMKLALTDFQILSQYL